MVNIAARLKGKHNRNTRSIEQEARTPAAQGGFSLSAIAQFQSAK
jgi:hypothetical protein